MHIGFIKGVTTKLIIQAKITCILNETQYAKF